MAHAAAELSELQNCAPAPLSSLFVDFLPTCRTRTILIRILGWHFDAVAVLIPGLSCRCRPSAPFAELVSVKGRFAELRE